MNPDTPWFEDKGVKMVLGFLVTMVCNAVGKKFGVALDSTEILTLGLTVASFIIGHKWKSASIAKASIAAGLAAQSAPAATLNK